MLRRILRRGGALRPAATRSSSDPFLYTLVPVVVDTMGDVFPGTRKIPKRVMDIVKKKSRPSDVTLERGLALFDEAASACH